MCSSDLSGDHPQWRYRLWRHRRRAHHPQGYVHDDSASTSPAEAAITSDAHPTFQIPDAFRRTRPIGEINPLTGEEYLTNTVRKHPTIEEYVQVYDRTTHEWSDVREDYFWEFQEKKKQMMGKEYRSPIRI